MKNQFKNLKQKKIVSVSFILLFIYIDSPTEIKKNPISITECYNYTNNIENGISNAEIGNKYVSTQPCVSSQTNNFLIGENRQLLIASKKGDKEKVLELLNVNSIQINFQDENGWSGLHYSCDEGNLKIVEILIKAGADINLKTIDKKTPLHLAASQGYFDITKLLIENGADITAIDNEKNLPVHLCAMGNHTELLCYMLDKYQSINIKNLYGKTPYDLVTKDETIKAISKYVRLAQKENFHKIKIHTTNNKQANSLMKQIKNNNGYKVKVKNIKYNSKYNNNTSNSKAKASNVKAINIKGKISNIHTNTSNNNISTSASNSNQKSLHTKQIKLPERVKVTVEPTSSKTPSVRKNYALKGITTNKKSESSTNTNNLLGVNKTIRFPNKSSPSHSHSHSKSKKATNVNKFVVAPLQSSSQRENRSVQKNAMFNHKTISLPKFNHININNDLRRGRSANKSNCIDSKSKVANVEISLDYSQRNNISDNEKEEKDNINIIETLNTNEDKKEEDHEQTPTEKPNELVSLINVSCSSEEENDNSSNDISDNEECDNNNSDKKNKIGPSSFICLGLLGKGSFGEVYLVKKKKTNELYAMKVLDKDRIMAQNIFKYAMTERNVLSLTSHPFIVQLHYAFQTNEKLFLLLDYCPGGDLAEQLSIQARFSEPKAKFYLCEIVLALGDLHQKDIIFRDLKPDNVVLDADGHAMLTDFGLSREGVYDAKIAKSFCGSIAYLAPEMLNRSGHGKAVDWYLLGVLFYEMLVGIPPFFTNNKEQIYQNIKKGDLKIPNFVSEKATKLLRALLKRDPSTRLGSKDDVEEIKAHEYFKDVNWDRVYHRELKPPKLQKSSNTVQLFNEPKLFIDDDDNEIINNDMCNYNSNENGGAQNAKFEGWSFVQNPNLNGK